MRSGYKSEAVISLKGVNAEYSGAINSKRPRFLSAFWGLDNGINGLDGMPITFSWLIDPKSIDLSDFRVIRSDGTFTVPTGATLLPANESNETQTILLIGNFGDAASNVRPVRVQLVGELVGHPPNSTRSKSFSNLISPPILPLEAGPYIVDAWRIDPALLVGDPNASTVGSTFIRVVWAGGITDYPTGNEVGVDVKRAYRLTYLYQGKIVTLTPLDIGDLNDGDNMHDLSFPEIPVDAKLLSITLPGGYVEDPNGDANSTQVFRFRSSYSDIGNLLSEEKGLNFYGSSHPERTIVPANYIGDIEKRPKFTANHVEGIIARGRLGGSKFGTSTKIYAPFTSNYSSSTTTLSWELQGIKVNPYRTRGKQASYIITGTTGSAIGAGGVGAVYVGAIDGKSTSSGSGSGQWINFNVPFADATGTSVYGPDILSPGKGPGGIGNVALVGTWTNSNPDNIFGFYYEGSIDHLNIAPTDTTGFKSFQATTTAGNNKLANYTYLHSIDGGYAVGNFSTRAGFINYSLNSGLDSGSYVYDPIANSQIDAVYTDGYSYHSLFGIWQNNNKSYTVSGGASNAGLQDNYLRAVIEFPSLGQGLSQDAVLGKGMIADIDPLTGNVTNEKFYNFQNDPGSDVLTHFQGIYYAGNGVYQAPFDAITSSSGKLNVGIAYIKRQEDGTFSDNALWQTFRANPSDPQGFLLSNDSVAGSASVGAFSNDSFTSFASISETRPYLFAAQLLH